MGSRAASSQSHEKITSIPPEPVSEVPELLRLTEELGPDCETIVKAARAFLRATGLAADCPSRTDLPRLHSAPGLAQRFSVHPLTIRRAYRAGRLRGFRFLGTLRFLERDVIALLREEGVPVPDENRP